MDVGFRTLHLEKRFPLAISRGTITGSDNLFVSVTENGMTGWGEMAPGATEGADSAEAGERALRAFVSDGLDPCSIHATWAKAWAVGVAPCAMAALDMALWDLRAKQADLPMHRMLGLGRRAVTTSLTVGINPPEVVRERVPLLLAQGARALKIKLGAPEGIEADKAIFASAAEAADGSGAVLRVDANGGWSLDEARDMMVWLAERGAEYVEQPLPRGAEDQLPALFARRPLPIFLDESCRVASDIPGFAGHVDGVNLKLMKCGGITEALRIVATARAFGLKTMIGCMGESSVSIAAGAALSELFDFIDLDSHLNLDPDPAEGAPLVDGRILPSGAAGHGGRLKDA
jgi:muconate cycloisomerase